MPVPALGLRHCQLPGSQRLQAHCCPPGPSAPCHGGGDWRSACDSAKHLRLRCCPSHCHCTTGSSSSSESASSSRSASQPDHLLVPGGLGSPARHCHSCHSPRPCHPSPVHSRCPSMRLHCRCPSHPHLSGSREVPVTIPVPLLGPQRWPDLPDLSPQPRSLLPPSLLFPLLGFLVFRLGFACLLEAAELEGAGEGKCCIGLCPSPHLPLSSGRQSLATWASSSLLVTPRV